MSERTTISAQRAGKTTAGSRQPAAGASPVGGDVCAIGASWRGWQSVGLSWLSQVFSGTPACSFSVVGRSVAQAQRAANLSLERAAAKRTASVGFRGTVVPVRGEATANIRRLSERDGKTG